MSQLIKEHNCIILMFANGGVVQEAQRGEIIRHGTEWDGLYYVNKLVPKGSTLLDYGSSDQQLWMCYRRLEHPSIGYLKKLFPSLTKSLTSLNCETCVLAKSHKNSYPSSSSHSNKPFSLIHSSVWGPALEFNYHSFFLYLFLFINDCTRMSWVD